MDECVVRFDDHLFDELDQQLPGERSSEGVPSVSDFLIFDLPPLRDLPAMDFDGNTLVVADAPDVKMLIQVGTLLRRIAVYATPTADTVSVFAVDLDREPHERFE